MQRKLPSGVWAGGPPKQHTLQRKELEDLRAEVATLRAKVSVGPVPEGGGDQEADTAEPDLEQIQAAYTAMCTAFGAESQRAKEVGMELDRL